MSKLTEHVEFVIGVDTHELSPTAAVAERRARKEVEDALAAFCAVGECPTPDTTK